MIRTFLALQLDEATADYLTDLVARLAPTLPGLRFVTRENWHLTMVFLGNLTDSQLAEVHVAAREMATGAAPFTIWATVPGVFGKPNAPHTLWIGLGGEVDRLSAFQQRVTQVLRLRIPALASPRDGLSQVEHFHPHITLARPRHGLTGEAMSTIAALVAANPRGPAMRVDHLAVMRSDLAPNGAHYTLLSSATFDSAE